MCSFASELGLSESSKVKDDSTPEDLNESGSDADNDDGDGAIESLYNMDNYDGDMEEGEVLKFEAMVSMCLYTMKML